MEMKGLFMNDIKKYLWIFTVLILLPNVVSAGSIRFNTPTKTSDDTYKFTLTIENMNLNYIRGRINITNGTIYNITMHSGWSNKTGISNNFYFYHNGKTSGSFTVATIEVKMTGNSEYTVPKEYLKYGLNKCSQDQYGTYFGEDGNIISKYEFDKTCSISKDASLSSLSISTGTISPTFEPSLEIYGTTVENNISMVHFSATTNNNKAKIISGSNCELKVGVNICKIVVQAEAGNTKTYSVAVTRKNASNNTLSTDASISNLVVHNGTLTRTFDPKIKEYNLKVNKGADNIYFTFITNSNQAMNTSQKCNINADTNSCKLTITAEDGVTKNSYTFYIVKDETSSSQSNVQINNNSPIINSKPQSNNNKNNNSSSSIKKEDKNQVINNNTNQNDNPTDSTTTNDTNKEKNPVSKEEEKNKEEKVENKTTEEKSSQEKKETIHIPVMNKEMSKKTFSIIIGIVDLLLGILIGVYISKIKKESKKKK